jgi:hypothetical protein
MVPLSLAVMLEPDARGHGTHQQLGLRPCTFIELFGCRCPACGMTTSWANLVRLRLVDALRANVGGTILGLASVLAVPWLLVSAVSGRWVVRTPDIDVLILLVTVVVLVTLIDWGIRLMAGLT